MGIFLSVILICFVLFCATLQMFDVKVSNILYRIKVEIKGELHLTKAMLLYAARELWINRSSVRVLKDRSFVFSRPFECVELSSDRGNKLKIIQKYSSERCYLAMDRDIYESFLKMHVVQFAGFRYRLVGIS